MSDIKSIEQIQFCDLFAQLQAHDGSITAREVAAVLKMTPSQVSQILAGKRGTRPLNVEKLRSYVNQVCGIKTDALHDAPEDAAVWRERAKRAEQELADLRSGLRDLLARPSSKIQERADKVEAEIRSSGRSSNKQYPMLSA